MANRMDQFVEVFTAKVADVPRGSVGSVIDVLNRQADASTGGPDVRITKDGVYRLSDQSMVSHNCVGQEHQFGVDHGEKLFVIKHINHQP